jgi:hypothetical protein
MITRSRFLFPILILSSALIVPVVSVKSQSPQPVVVQAASGTSVTTSPPAQSAAAAQNAAAVQVAIQTLQRLKAANEEVLKRQEDTLRRLEEIQQGADELKIFAKRG